MAGHAEQALVHRLRRIPPGPPAALSSTNQEGPRTSRAQLFTSIAILLRKLRRSEPVGRGRPLLAACRRKTGEPMVTLTVRGRTSERETDRGNAARRGYPIALWTREVRKRLGTAS